MEPKPVSAMGVRFSQTAIASPFRIIILEMAGSSNHRLTFRAALVSRLVFDALARARCRVGYLNFAIIAVLLSPVTAYHLVTAPSGVNCAGFA